MVKHLPYKKYLKVYSKQNRSLPTKSERLFWHMCLSKDKTGFRFLRQKPLLGYIVDFYCAPLRLAIEIDGDTHQEKYEYDQKRTLLFNQLGVKVIRFQDDLVLKQLEGCYMILMKTIIERQKELSVK